MNDSEIDQVSRSWAGHLATNPKLRQRVNALAGDDAALADLVNSTVKPQVKVGPADVPKVKAHVLKAFGGPLPEDHERGITFNRLDDPPWG
jgi:hypothetical protein